MFKDISDLARSLGAEVIENADLSQFTSFRTGGKASLMLFPQTVDSLLKIISKCRESSVKYFILGNGSNIIAPDEGYDGVIIRFDRNFSHIEMIDDCTVFCQAGAPLKSLCLFALEHSLSGLEFAFGIPGSLGGAVFMNAGAYGGEMKDVLFRVTHIDGELKAGYFEKDELDLGYRHSVYSDNGYIITGAYLKMKKEDPELIRQKMDENMQKRRDKQPLEYPSAGSTFKRPEGYFAGALIEQSGLKGKSIGGAQVSEKHAGFIINKDNATSADILKLIEFVKNTVYKDSGVMLEPEVRILK
ncbi:MAG: UDP-N-acetylmuramate dehydrogenase [Clostridiales bacterium]|nr:UDP-N-acetylmuramate dehydrogenase [Clostridiales bacterium]